MILAIRCFCVMKGLLSFDISLKVPFGPRECGPKMVVQIIHIPMHRVCHCNTHIFGAIEQRQRNCHFPASHHFKGPDAHCWCGVYTKWLLRPKEASRSNPSHYCWYTADCGWHAKWNLSSLPCISDIVFIIVAVKWGPVSELIDRGITQQLKFLSRRAIVSACLNGHWQILNPLSEGTCDCWEVHVSWWGLGDWT